MGIFAQRVYWRPSVVCLIADIAHKRRGTAQRNAGIALAKMAQDPWCLRVIRDLHGIEIMYHYVKL